MSIDPAVTTRLFDVRGRRAVVTGAASGLGLAAAEVLAECGARVTLADIDSERLAEQAGRLAAGGCEFHAARRDDDASVRSAFADAARPTAASTSSSPTPGSPPSPARRTPAGRSSNGADDAWRSVVGVNLDGVLTGCARRPA